MVGKLRGIVGGVVLPRWSALVLAGLALGAVGVAQAAHWPFFGGDAGRSGYQPVDEAGLPVAFQYDKTAETEREIRTSPLTTAGGPEVREVVYGTQNGRVHLQRLATGAPVGAEPGVLIDDNAQDPDVFSGLETFDGLANGSVSFVETSGPGGL